MPRKVFISYRSLDKPRVLPVAQAIIKAGIDVWLDEWDIKPGENFVTGINQGLSDYDCALVFLSHNTQTKGWQWEEITILKDLFVDEHKPIIPVVLDDEVKVPPMLRVHSRLRADQIDELLDAIEGRSSKPPLGQARAKLARLQFAISLRQLPDNAIGVTAHLDGQLLVPELPVHPDATFHLSLEIFHHTDVPRSSPECIDLGPSERKGACPRER